MFSGGRFGLGPRALSLVVVVGEACNPRTASADGMVTYEVREEITGMALPSRTYDVTGMCATGTGLAPASLYAQGGDGRGTGWGAGIGGRLGYHYMERTPNNGFGPTWWGFRAGAGLDINLLYANVSMGTGDSVGKLCERVRKDGADIHYQGSSMLLAQFPAFIGVERGLGTVEKGSWHGIVLGAAWAPAIGYLKPWVAHGQGNFSYLGTELTLDFVTLNKDTAHNNTPQQVGKRLALFILLPAQDHGAVILTLSFGVVFY